MPPPTEMSPTDLRASIVAMFVRNAIEDIHADPDVGLTDDVMARMNPLVRRAIWEALEIIDNAELHQAALAWTTMIIPDYWESPSTLTPLGNLDLAGKAPRFLQPSAPQTTVVQVTVPARGRSYFTCPNCGTVVRFDNKYPFGWRWKVCPGCRWQWVRTGRDIGPHRDDLPAGQNQAGVEVLSSGRPIS